MVSAPLNLVFISTTVQRNLVTQEIITSIAEEISIDWKDVGRRLKLKESILDNIEDEYRKTKEKSTQMLNKWKQLNAASATIQVLMVALKQAGRRDIAETLEEMTQVHASEQDEDVRTATTALEKLELSADGFSDRGKPLTTPEK
ncbi:FAS-associated death domain protein-like [Nematostella vectensis]|uniref:FAS-associated death domain protein-like n=1 Tax=Nematostella vectensis TaxID=45351 RepID=UPI002076FDEA|nr:FAS-associated death domain protein-like [Nematostella vectensis]